MGHLSKVNKAYLSTEDYMQIVIASRALLSGAMESYSTVSNLNICKQVFESWNKFSEPWTQSRDKAGKNYI